MRMTPPLVLLLAGGVAALAVPLARAAPPRAQAVSAAQPGELGEWDRRIARMRTAGALFARWERDDLLVPGRRHVRLVQLHDGVPVEGGELVQQTSGPDTVSVFATLFADVVADTRPTLTAD